MMVSLLCIPIIAIAIILSCIIIVFIVLLVAGLKWSNGFDIARMDIIDIINNNIITVIDIVVIDLGKLGFSLVIVSGAINCVVVA